MAIEPKVSVVMSVFNGAKYLREAVDAVLAQTFPQFELLIVDDGSVDGTQQILSGFSDVRIRLFRNDRNLGPAAARNRAFAAARGEYIAIQDADDASVPARLATQVGYLEANPDVALLGSAVLHVQTNGSFRDILSECADFDGGRVKTGAASASVSRAMYDTAWILLQDEAPRKAFVLSPLSDLSAKWTLLSHCAFDNPSVMFRRKLYEQDGGFSEDPNYHYCEDYEMFCRYVRHCRVANLSAILLAHRGHESSHSNLNEARQQEQVNEVAKSNLCWVMGWRQIDPLVWSAWRKFWYTPGIAPVLFSAGEVEALSDFLPRLTSAFYAAYDLDGEEVGHHRRRMHYLWAKHAFGLAYRSSIDLRARLTLSALGLKLLGAIMVPEAPNRGSD